MVVALPYIPDAPWELPDEKLLAECRFEAFVGSGPGGQKRHKTNAAVRLTHQPSGITAHISDSRSQRENRIHALRLLRHKLAMEGRHAVDALSFRPPAYLAEYAGLRLAPKNPLYPGTVAMVLDVLEATHWEAPRAAALLQVSTSAVIRFLREDHALWTLVRQKHSELGMKPLR